MKNIKAFPSNQKWVEGNMKKHEMHTGMTLLDYFAGQAIIDKQLHTRCGKLITDDFEMDNT